MTSPDLDVVVDPDAEQIDLRPLARLLIDLARARRQREADAGKELPDPTACVRPISSSTRCHNATDSW